MPSVVLPPVEPERPAPAPVRLPDPPAISPEPVSAEPTPALAAAVTATPSAPASPPVEKPSTAAADAMRNVHTNVLRSSQSSASSSGGFGSGFGSSSGSFAAASRAASSSKSKSSRKSSGEGFRPSPKMYAAAGVIALILLVKFWPFGGGPSDSSVLETYTQIWTQWQTLRKGPADVNRQKFIVDSKAKLAPLLKKLESQAGPGAPAKQFLLWGGKDYLLKALEIPKPDPKLDKEVERHLTAARNAINGTQIAQAPPPTVREPD
jgi:hypothetical protein